MATPIPDRQRQAAAGLARLFSAADSSFVIHYACQRLDQDEREGSPRVTAVAVRNLASGEVTSYSIHAEAELLRLSPVQVLTRMNRLELLMLEKLFAFFGAHPHARFVHWNMRDEVYGFQALTLRYAVLGGPRQGMPGRERIDLARLLADMFGPDAGSALHLASLARYNGLPVQGFLHGKAEADAFEHGQYAAVKRSTLAKVRLISDILDLARAGTLRVNAPAMLVPARRADQPAVGHLFISHASEDHAVVSKLVAQLEERGIACWYAPRDIRLGADYQHSIVEAIEHSSGLVLLMSEAANDSIHIARELNLADQEMKPIYPLSVDGARPRGSLRYQLSNRQWIDLGPDPAQGLQLLQQQLLPAA